MGVSAHVLSIPSIRPLERKGLTEAITRTGHIVKLGEHSVHGGVGSLVAEIMVKEGIRAHLTRPGVPEGEFAKAGPRQDIRAYHEFDWQGIVDASKKLMDRPA